MEFVATNERIEPFQRSQVSKGGHYDTLNLLGWLTSESKAVKCKSSARIWGGKQEYHVRKWMRMRMMRMMKKHKKMKKKKKKKKE